MARSSKGKPEASQREDGGPTHPGQYVKQSILAPKKLSVADAAKLIGVSRSDVSAFLSGKVAITPEMATRVERSLAIPAKTLLDMQAAFDLAKARGVPPTTRVYVLPFLNFKANDIEDWASRSISARTRLPGHDDAGQLHADLLAEWVKTVRDACARLDRSEAADSILGKLLANAPVGDDGVWPCEPVRQLIEDIQSERMSCGACIGVYNSRGVHFRGEGGDDERVLADKYRAWANALQYIHPFVASSLLMEVVKNYEHQANYHDTEAGIRRRLR